MSSALQAGVVSFFTSSPSTAASTRLLFEVSEREEGCRVRALVRVFGCGTMLLLISLAAATGIELSTARCAGLLLVWSASAEEVLAAPPCDDRDTHCFTWANVGECESKAAYMHNVCKLSCGLCADGSEGDDDDGADGYDDNDNNEAPQVVVLGPSTRQTIAFPLVQHDPIVEMSAGELHLLLRLASGRVLSFGDDSLGQLGQPRIARRSMLTRRPPHPVPWPHPLTGKPAIAVSAGRMHSGAILRDGELILWGENTHAQCGMPREQTPMDAVAPAELIALASHVAMPTHVPLPVRAVALSLGEVRRLAAMRARTHMLQVALAR